MVKKILSLSIIGVFLLSFLSFTTLSHAQDTEEEVFDFRRAYQDFVFTFDQYKQKESEFELVRSQYLQSRTIAARAKAQEATYIFLQARDDVMKTYLTALRLRLSEAQGVSQDQKELLFTQLDNEVAWFDDHKNRISSAASLEDLTVDSNQAFNRYTKTSEPIVYKVLSAIAVGKEYVLRQKQILVVGELKNKLAEIRLNNDLNTEVMERSIIEIENRITRTEAKEADALKIVSNFEKNVNRSRDFNTVVLRLSEGIQYLKDSNVYLREIISRIKRG